MLGWLKECINRGKNMVKTKYYILVVTLFLIITYTYSQNYREDNLGKELITIINDNNVNIRDKPDLQGKVIDKLNYKKTVIIVSMKNTIDIVNGIKDYWFYIYYENDSDPKIHGLYKGGWVFGKYLDKPLGIKPSKFIIDYKNRRLVTENSYIPIEIFESKDSKYIGFNLNSDCDNYRYTYYAGIYIIKKDTGEIVSEIFEGSLYPSNWMQFSFNNKYIIVDYGTSPPPRRITIYTIESKQIVFTGYYYRDIELERNTITIVFSENLNNLDQVEKSIINVGEQLKKQNSNMLEKEIETNDVLYKYRYNIENGNKTIIGIELYYVS
jgi:hypothetical protein